MKSYRLEKAAIAGLCAIAAVRVFLFAAAFPLFNNMDEQAHADLVLKYARGYWPSQLVERFDRESARLFAWYGTPEYATPPSRFLGGRAPPPMWRRSPANIEQTLPAREQRWLARANHEGHSPPVYYVLAGLWYRLAGLVDWGAGHRLYWIRFLNVPCSVLLIWFAYRFCATALPERPEHRLGVPLLLAFLPLDVFYAINSDAIAPTLGVISLLAMLKWYRLDTPGVIGSIATGLIVAANFLVKYTHLAIPAVFSVLILVKTGRAFSGKRHQHRWWRAPLWAGLALSLPIVLFGVRNQMLFGHLTGTNDKVEALGWSHHTVAQACQHPIFTLSGFSDFWKRLMPTLWRGEFRWQRNPIASPTADVFYLASSSILLLAAAVQNATSSWRAHRRATKKRGAAENTTSSGATIVRAMLWSSLGLSVLCLVALSASFDYGACFYPSREFPYFASGRLIGSALVPFLVLYMDGAASLFQPLERMFGARARVAGALAIAILSCVVMSVSEIQLTKPFFANPYNWFHLP